MDNIGGAGEKMEDGVVAEVRLLHADGRESTDGIFLPGEELMVVVSWVPQPSCRGFDLRLGWETEGKGTEDRETVLRDTWESELRGEMKKTIRWVLPRGPLSCEGSLLRIRWFVDCYINPAGIRARRDLILSAIGGPIVLPKGESEWELSSLIQKVTNSQKAP